jgi:hypothetical protein
MPNNTTTALPFASDASPSTQPNTAKRLAMIGQLQEQLRLQSVPTSGALPSTAYNPSSPPRGGVPPVITVPNPTIAAGVPQTVGNTTDPPMAGALSVSPFAIPSPAFVRDQAPGPPAPSVSFASTPPSGSSICSPMVRHCHGKGP